VFSLSIYHIILIISYFFQGDSIVNIIIISRYRRMQVLSSRIVIFSRASLYIIELYIICRAVSHWSVSSYSRGGQREETYEPSNILINMEEPKYMYKKRSYYYIIRNTHIKKKIFFKM